MQTSKWRAMFGLVSGATMAAASPTRKKKKEELHAEIKLEYFAKR